jgi:septum formation protein
LKAAAPSRLILASGSPRRRELLTSAGLSFEVVSPDIDETQRKGESARDYVFRLALEKAQAGAKLHPDALVLAADTTVAIGKLALAKPADAAEGKAMLKRLSGKSHKVWTGVAALHGRRVRRDLVETTVTFQKLKGEALDWYLQTTEPYDKAGGYAIQGIFGQFITSIRGSYSNVVGLPLAESLAMLAALGWKRPWEK